LNDSGKRLHPSISAVIIAYNEEDRLHTCLSSLSWVDEIVVVDSGSADGTMEVARRFTDRVLMHPFENYASQKQWAIEQATHNWIISLDADEEISSPLREEILDLPLEAWECRVAMEMPVISEFFGRWLRFGGWYPNFHLRCFNRTECSLNPLPVHESVKTTGQTARLKHAILHRPYRSLGHYLEKMDRYSSLAAAEMYRNGKLKEIHPLNIIIRPLACFLRRFVVQMGFLDGFAGIVANGYHVVYVFLKYAKIWEMRRLAASTRRPDDEVSHRNHPLSKERGK